MVHYYRGDKPAEVLEVEPASSDVALSAYSSAEAELEPPAGGVPVTVPAVIEPSADDGELVVRVTMDAELTVAGIHRLVITLAGDGLLRTLAPIRIPVEEAGAGWYTIDAARADWPGAPDDDARLYDLLAVARVQVEAFAPALAELAPVPVHYRSAQLMQARNVWNAGQIDPNATTYGGGEFSVPVYPLDWTVRQMLRPRSGVPRVG